LSGSGIPSELSFLQQFADGDRVLDHLLDGSSEGDEMHALAAIEALIQGMEGVEDPPKDQV